MNQIKQGYKQTKVGVIPEDWEVVKLKDIAERVTRKNSINCTNVLTISAQYGLINQEKFFNKSIASKDLSRYILLNKGEFAYNKSYSNGYPMGAIKKLNLYEKGVLSSLYIYFKLKNVSIDFYEHYFEAGLLNKEISNIAQEGVRNHGLLNIGIEEFFSDIFLKHPPLKEQEKIAEILTTWDEAITKQTELIKTKELLKIALMQKLLSGEVRFSGFSEEWKEVKLGEIGKFYKGKGISKENLSEEGTPCIRYGELYTTYNEKIDNVISKTNVDIKELFLSKSNDIIIPASGETAIDIATASCVLRDNIALSGDLNVIRTKENGIFLSYYLNIIAKHRIASIAQGVSVVHLYPSQLENLLLSLPSLLEQQKIAEVLSLSDDEINLLKNELDELKLQKKALMQKLLNGEVRVTI